MIPIKILIDIIIALLSGILIILSWIINRALAYKTESNKWKMDHHAEQVRQAEQLKNIEDKLNET